MFRRRRCQLGKAVRTRRSHWNLRCPDQSQRYLMRGHAYADSHQSGGDHVWNNLLLWNDESQRPRPESFGQPLSSLGPRRGDLADHLNIADVNDHRTAIRPPFRLKYPRYRKGIECVRSQPVNRLRGKRDQTPSTKQSCCVPDLLF